MNILRFPNQGHMIAANWDAEGLLKDWTAYTGDDGQRFAPPFDRNGYTAGVVRRLLSARIKYAGLPVARLTLPVVTDGQIAFLQDTFTEDGVAGNVTIAIHVPGSMGKEDTANFNAVFNLDVNQLTSLARRADGYEDFVLEFVIVEVL